MKFHKMFYSNPSKSSMVHAVKDEIACNNSVGTLDNSFSIMKVCSSVSSTVPIYIVLKPSWTQSTVIPFHASSIHLQISS